MNVFQFKTTSHLSSNSETNNHSWTDCSAPNSQLDLHMGHVLLVDNQVVTHCKWKLCPHFPQTTGHSSPGNLAPGATPSYELWHIPQTSSSSPQFQVQCATPCHFLTRTRSLGRGVRDLCLPIEEPNVEDDWSWLSNDNVPDSTIVSLDLFLDVISEIFLDYGNDVMCEQCRDRRIRLKSSCAVSCAKLCYYASYLSFFTYKMCCVQVVVFYITVLTNLAITKYP